MQSWLSWFLKGVLVVGFLLLAGRLFELQIIKGGYYRSLAEGNRIKRIVLPAPRGRILARGGEILADNIQITKQVDGMEVGDWLRDYRLGPAAAHLTGYLGQVGPEEVGKIKARCPQKGLQKPGSWVGRSGLEEEYDCLLTGRDGEKLIEVDIKGKQVRLLGEVKPVPGEDLKTNINFALQKKIAEILADKKGAAVALDAGGQILALFSAPAFDPAKVGDFVNNSDLPLFNRAIGGRYHPGSVFKPIVALAALEEKAIDANFVFDDPGVITVNNYSYSNWYFSQYGGKEGRINLVRAMARSTDTFFYKIGEMVGVDAIDSWAEKFNLNEKTGIDLPGEVDGLLPGPDWKKKVKGELWFLGNTYHLAIGQGDLALTPLEIDSALGAIASGGKLCQPRLVGLGDCRDLKIKRENLDLVKEGMKGVCRPGGTGYTFFDFSGPVACKTGTAETNEDGKTHAWFSVFTPADFPEIILTVLVEGGGEGSKIAGPLARSILDYWQVLNNP